MRARVLMPLALLGALLSGCGLSPAPLIDLSSDLGPSRVVAEDPAPVVDDGGTAVAGWRGRIIAEPTEDAAAFTTTTAEPHSAYQLDSGDKLRIFVYAQPSLSRIYAIDGEGFISVPLIGNVQARGMTTRGLETTIASRLGSEFVREPHVTVDIQQYRPFFILGEVRNPGQYPYAGGMTVDAAVATAGGYSDRADERKVQITRRINSGIERLDVPGDAEVRAGDTIHVKERWF